MQDQVPIGKEGRTERTAFEERVEIQQSVRERLIMILFNVGYDISGHLVEVGFGVVQRPIRVRASILSCFSEQVTLVWSFMALGSRESPYVIVHGLHSS